MTLREILAAERRRQRWLLRAASTAAAAGGAAAVLLLGLSGWFIAACSVAGAAGVVGAAGLNYLLPSAAIRLLTIVRTGARHAERLTGHDAALGLLARLRPALFLALATSPPATALGLSAGDATARLIGDVGEIEAQVIRRPARIGAIVAWGTGVALLASAGGAWAAGAALLPAGAAVLALRLGRRHKRYGRAVPAANGALRQEFATLLAAAPELRAYGLEDWAARRLAARGTVLARAQAAATECWSEPLLTAAGGGAAVLTLCACAGAPLPVAGMAGLVSLMVGEGFAAHLRLCRRLGEQRAAEQRLDAILGGAAARSNRPAPAARPTIGIARLGAVLRPGTVAGLIGPSGCGKTRLLNTLVRLDETGSEIWLDGRDLGDFDPLAVRACFALAAQDAPVLSGTVRDNLLLGDPGASDDRLWEALHDAVLDDRVRALSGGLDQWLGQDGTLLSGGERRRLSLARAYMRAAPWLLLDEPTEGLDAPTEALVVARLASRLARHGQGAIIATHRPCPLGACVVSYALRHLDEEASVRPVVPETGIVAR